MIRTISLATVLMTSILAGCTAESPTVPGADELAGENGQDGEVPKADGVDNFNFLAVHGRATACTNIWCAKYDLNRVNRSTTTCLGGSSSAKCSVHDIDWAALHLSQAKITKLEKALAREAADSSVGTQVLVRGSFKSYVDFTAFVPTEVWIAQRADGTDDGTFVRVFDRGIRCITAPCPQFEEGRLNSTREMAIEGFDYGDSAEDAMQEAVYTATSAASGAIVVGDRTTRMTTHGGSEKLRTVNQAYLPVK